MIELELRASLQCALSVLSTYVLVTAQCWGREAEMCGGLSGRPSSKAPKRKCTRSSDASCWNRPSADSPPVTRAVQHTRTMRGQGRLAASALHRVCTHINKSAQHLVKDGARNPGTSPLSCRTAASPVSSSSSSSGKRLRTGPDGYAAEAGG